MTVRVAKGTYALPDRNLQLEIADDIELGRHQIYYVGGDNGLGKTSFLEQVLVPALQQERMPYLYLGQDLGLQLYTLKASLAVSGVGLAHVDDAHLISLWIAHGHEAQTFLLDEFDKYYADYRFVFAESASFIESYVVVSHACQFQAPAGFASYQVRFELIGHDGDTKHVRAQTTRR